MSADFLIQTLVNALSLGGTYALLAIGLALIFSIMGMINFAHGDLMTVAGYAIVALASLSWPFALAALVAVVAAAAAAVVTDVVAFRPVRGRSLATMLLTSYAVSVLLHMLFQNFISPRPIAVAVPDWLSGQLLFLGHSIGTIQVLSIAASIALMGALAAILRLTGIGIGMRAAAQDFAIARLVGINANRAILTAFGLSGLLAGVAGALWVAQRGSVDPLMGFLPIIKAFIATVIGGLGSLVGAVCGGFLLGIVEVGLRSFLPETLMAYRDAIALAMAILLLIVRPAGLIGSTQELRQ